MGQSEDQQNDHVETVVEVGQAEEPSNEVEVPAEKGLDDANDVATDASESPKDDASKDDNDTAEDDADASDTDSSGPEGSRRTSERTEALIHAAARDIVEQIEADRGRESMNTETDESYISESEGCSGRPSDAHSEADSRPRDSIGSDQESEHTEGGAEDSYVSQSRSGSGRPSDARSIAQSVDESDHDSVHSPRPSSTSHRESTDSHQSVGSHTSAASTRSARSHRDSSHSNRESIHRSATAQSHHSTEDERSSSRNEENDDVFSDHSPRSSMGSLSESENKKTDKMATFDQSPRISDISQYDHDDEFVPTIRGAPRPVFRSPSSVKAMQMSSPPASVYGSPRSGRRGMPTVSRLGSPSLSAQYSPKKTPPRFKRTTPPLVLLHVTLLPLRWGWGDVLERARSDDLSPDAKTVRDAWRQLQDRMGDTTVERGILLPHPQNDYEVLEERLLEALELPCRRRARILDCGHYLGPSNEMSLIEDSDSEEEDEDYYDDERRGSRRSVEKMHWCKTCRSEIRYDALGPAKIFRVKVYASNGLMKAGAWEACWKEMERVDVELEPLVDGVIQEEMSRLELEQERELDEQEREMDMRDRYEQEYDLPEDEYSDDEELEEQHLPEHPQEFEERELREDPADEPLEHHEEPEELPEESPADPPEEMPEEVPRDLPRNPSENPGVEDHVDRDASFMHRDSASRIPTPEPHFESVEEQQRRDEELFGGAYDHQTPHADHESAQARSYEQERSVDITSKPAAESTREMPSEQPRETRRELKNDSLPDLLVQSGRVLIQDKKNVIIGLLGILIVMLALRGGAQPQSDPRTFQTLVVNQEVTTVTVTHVPTQETHVMTTTEDLNDSNPLGTQASQLETQDYAQPEVDIAVYDSLPIHDQAEESLLRESQAEEEETQVTDYEVDEGESFEVVSEAAESILLAGSSEEIAQEPENSLDVVNAPDQPAIQELSVEVLKTHEFIRKTETVISERIVRVVETVTEVETATIKVTETLSSPTQSAEPQHADIESDAERNAELEVEPETGLVAHVAAPVPEVSEESQQDLYINREESDEQLAGEPAEEGVQVATQLAIEAPAEATIEVAAELVTGVATQAVLEGADEENAEENAEEHVEEPSAEPSVEAAELVTIEAAKAEAVVDSDMESVPEREL